MTALASAVAQHFHFFMAVSSKANPSAVLELKSASLSVLALMLKTVDLDLLRQTLAERYGAEAGLFDQEALCVDLAGVRDHSRPIDFAALVRLFKGHGLVLLAARGGSPEQMAAARKAGLVEAPEARSERAPSVALADNSGFAATYDQSAASEPFNGLGGPSLSSASHLPPMIVDKPVRSGQQIYARGRDLIVTALVSYGAEVIADGSIHVYAPLRGRALAGAKGDELARVYAVCMEPQLLSIAGNWKTFENGLSADVAGKPAQAWLEGPKLLVQPLKY